jgi:catechol 2,3-dioxygenase-like lactoylglutathione lyase family enzyme
VSDFERAVEFYCDGLGFELAERYDLDAGAVPDLLHSLEIDDAGKVTSQMIVNGSMKLELLHYPGRPSQGTPSPSRGLLGLTHLSFIVDDVDVAAARLVKHGGTVIAHTRVNVGIPLVFLTDPDGTRIELMDMKPQP